VPAVPFHQLQSAPPIGLFLALHDAPRVNSSAPPLEDRPCLYRAQGWRFGARFDDRPPEDIEQKNTKAARTSQIGPKRIAYSCSGRSAATAPPTRSRRSAPAAGSCGGWPAAEVETGARWPTAGIRAMQLAVFEADQALASQQSFEAIHQAVELAHPRRTGQQHPGMLGGAINRVVAQHVGFAQRAANIHSWWPPARQRSSAGRRPLSPWPGRGSPPGGFRAPSTWGALKLLPIFSSINFGTSGLQQVPLGASALRLLVQLGEFGESP